MDSTNTRDQPLNGILTMVKTVIIYTLHRFHTHHLPQFSRHKEAITAGLNFLQKGGKTQTDPAMQALLPGEREAATCMPSRSRSKRQANAEPHNAP